ncbi:MAG TPA: ABC transporter ATP-binding protein [Methylomirabilota bacterium]|jgi:ABC-type Fe3+/spermidine/putrescine transport system ATPase subunit
MSRPLVDVRLEGIRTAVGPPPPLVDVSLHVRYGEFFTLLGPPHSGKTAVLRAVAGFTPLAAGRILIDGHDIHDVPARRRGIGYVFHEGALWPHMTVREHVAFGLRELGMAENDVKERLDVVLGRLGLRDAATRRPDALPVEGRRRLALARALAVEPRVLVLDEPLAHLDPIARKTLRLELAKLHRDLAVTTICATRDATDALALSDRIAVLEGGRVLQTGDPEHLYQRPNGRAVAETLGPANFLPVRVVEVRELGVVVATEAGDRVPVAGLGQFREGARGLLVLRPELISITEAAMARGPGIPGRIALRVFEGARHLYEVDIGLQAPVRVELPAAGETRIFRLGDRVRVEVSSETVVLVADES